MIASSELRVTLDDGAVTHLSCYGESGPAILCVHGMTSSRRSWERFAERFGALYRIFAYDQRGHGDSAAVDGPMTLERSLADLRTVAATIGQPLRALVGHSWGGGVVIAAGRELDAARVVAIDPMIHRSAGTFMAGLIEETRPLLTLEPERRERAIRDRYADLAPIDLDAKVHALRTMTVAPLVALDAENGIDLGHWDLRADVTAYPKPLLVMLADPRESIVSEDDVAEMRRSGGPNVSIEVFEGQGHSLHRSSFDRFAAKVQPFIVAP